MVDRPETTRRYPSSQQKVVLLELLEADPELGSGKFSDSLTRKIAQDRWDNISATLNNLKGAKRSSGEWRKTWQDMKSHAKRRDVKTSKTTRQTSNGLEFPGNGCDGSDVLRPEVVFIEDIEENRSWKRQCIERSIESMDMLQQTIQESNAIMRETLEIKKEKLMLYKRHLELKKKFYSDQSLSTKKITIKKEV